MTTPQYLFWSLISPVAYAAGQELSATVQFRAPSDGTYYLKGFLFDADAALIAGSEFNVALPVGGTYYVNSATEDPTEFVMLADEYQTTSCKFTFTATNMILGLFLYKMAGATPDITADDEIGSVSVIMGDLTPAAEGLDVSSIMSLMITMMIVVMMMKMMSGAMEKD